MSKRRNLVICRMCGAERVCSDGLAKAALKGDITCVVCAGKGQTGYFVRAEKVWEVANAR